MTAPPPRTVAELVATLTPGAWERVNRELVAKLLTELAYEEVVRPAHTDRPDGGRDMTLVLGDLELSYAAHPRSMGLWRVDPATVEARRGGVPVPLPDADEVVATGAPAIGADPSTTAGLVGEIAATLLSDAMQVATGRPADELLDLDPLLLEGEMRGHPWIVASKGRVGFGADDLVRYSPEARDTIDVEWVAVDRGRVDLHAVPGLEHETVVAEQVGPEGWEELRARTAAGGADPDAVAYVPVHPWQWANRIVTLHAGDLARGRMVALGGLGARYAPQQSIRTLADLDHPDRRYMKLAVSILNTSVHRGIPRARATAAPALTEWFTGICESDPFLRETGLIMLGEVASASVGHPAFEAIPDVPYQHTEMLGAIWRTSVAPLLRPGERAITLAALIHRDPAGVSFAERLIARSGRDVDEWVTALHACSLPPLLHVLYRYGAAFSPHAQNCMVALVDDVPQRLVVKDFVDDAMVSIDPLPELEGMPAGARAAIGQGVESMVLSQWIQSGLLVCVHRYLAEILQDRMGYPESAFWASAERVVAAYQERFAAELGDRFALFDFEAPAFVKLCLNRVRILGRGYSDDPSRPVASAVGWVENPLAPAAAP
ncbi:MAG: IucA/IucC family siderophore biosynthesis protein [Thermoleophilia bacterium]